MRSSKDSSCGTGATKEDALRVAQTYWLDPPYGNVTLVKYYHTGSRREPFGCGLFNFDDEHDRYNHLFGWNQIEDSNLLPCPQCGAMCPPSDAQAVATFGDVRASHMCDGCKHYFGVDDD